MPHGIIKGTGWDGMGWNGGKSTSSLLVNTAPVKHAKKTWKSFSAQIRVLRRAQDGPWTVGNVYLWLSESWIPPQNFAPVEDNQ